MNEDFWEFVCGLQLMWRVIFAMDVAFLVLLAIGWQTIEPGSAAYVVATLDLALLLVVLGVVLFVNRRCEYSSRDARAEQ